MVGNFAKGTKKIEAASSHLAVASLVYPVSFLTLA
jgi:hypothetical protein